MGINFSIIRACYASTPPTRRLMCRDVAAEMGLSEGELIAAHAGDPRGGARPDSLLAVRLRPSWTSLLAALQGMGELGSTGGHEASRLTLRTCWHRVPSIEPVSSVDVGAELVVWQEFTGGDGTGQPLPHTLRIDPGLWAHGYAVEMTIGTMARRSLQFFDASGTLVHELALRGLGGGREAQWQALLRHWAHADQRPGLMFRTGPVPRQKAIALPHADCDETGWAQPVEVESLYEVLSAAAVQALPLAISAGLPAARQTAHDILNDVRLCGTQLLVRGERLEWRLDEALIDSIWLHRKPSKYGLHHSLELFDASGERLASVAAPRRPQRADPCAWRALLEQRLDLGLH